MNKKITQISIAAVIIIGTVIWLAWSGATDKANTSYFVTIPELAKMGDNAYKANIRVDGFVRPGSIVQSGTHVTFIIDEFESHSPKAGTGRSLKINYKGSEPPPDTFKDNSEAVSGGNLLADGTFQANQLQAKCASKYAPVTPGKPGESPASKPASAGSAPTQKSSATTPAAPGANSGARQVN
jgi:cytochrome c-type biogenesis protein CcmE